MFIVKVIIKKERYKMNITPVSINFKGQTPTKSAFIGNAIDKAAEVAEKNYKTPEDAFTRNHTDVHAAFWGEIAKGIGKAAGAIVNAVKDGVNKTIDNAANKAEEKFKTPEDAYTRNHTDVNAEITKGLVNTVISAVKAPFKKAEQQQEQK